MRCDVTPLDTRLISIISNDNNNWISQPGEGSTDKLDHKIPVQLISVNPPLIPILVWLPLRQQHTGRVCLQRESTSPIQSVRTRQDSDMTAELTPSKLSRIFSFSLRSYLLPIRVSSDGASFKFFSKNVLLNIVIYYILPRWVILPKN